MRLTCPNCGAQYEVDDSMIPPEGRDVQCSECSTTWFQPGSRARLPIPQRTPPQPTPKPPMAEANEVSEEPSTGSDVTESANTDRSRDDVVPPPTPDDASGAAPPAQDIPADAETATQFVQTIETDDAEVDTSETESSEGRRGLDPGVRDILKSEAEREARLRQAEAAPVETQAEMPLEEEPEDINRARRRSELEDAADAYEIDAAGATPSNGSRKDLFPDIEEINSTLRASPDQIEEVGVDRDLSMSRLAQRRRGVRFGFFATVIIAALAIWAYSNVGPLAQRIPQAAPALESYAERVDGARMWLDGLARRLAEDDGGS